MIKAVGIHDELLDNNPKTVHEMPDALMKACALFGVEAFLYGLSGISEYRKNGVLHAFRWTSEGYKPCAVDLPRYSVFNYAAGIRSGDALDQQWLSENTVMLNAHGIRKDHLQKAMLSTDLSRYAIPSIISNSFEETKHLLTLIPKAILKPVKGNMGRGILKVTKKGDDFFCQTPEGEYLFTEELFTSFERSYGFQENPQMILEPCLNILTDDGRAVDFRCQTSLDGEGKWRNVLTYGRIGASDVVSNISHGGSVTLAHEVLEQFVPGHSREKLDEINWLACRISELVEQLSKGTINCLGIDICIDRDSKSIYVIEANAGPGFKIVGPWPLALARAEYFKYRLLHD